MAIIDNGYRGVIFTSVTNLNTVDVGLYKGERISQIILIPLVGAQFLQATELGKSERGEKGFGSSGE